MIIYKFGGASVKDADAVRQLSNIVKSTCDKKLVVVVSAMGKITNALERFINLYYNQLPDIETVFNEIRQFHFDIIDSIFNDNKDNLFSIDDFKKSINSDFIKLHNKVNNAPTSDYDFEYDQIICFGEILSTKIVSAYLNFININNKWIDIRNCLKTDNNYREAKVDWDKSSPLVTKSFSFNDSINVYLTQGFIASSVNGYSSSLGREGSDYTASVLAFILNAESISVWKDVPGFLNADPKWFEKTEKLEEISYQEAIELAFYGAKIIHPKTIKPIQNKSIPLYVKSFLNPEDAGTVIRSIKHKLELVPVYIRKQNQVLLSISPLDFSFIIEENISKIFALFARYKVKVNLIQNSAISLSVCISNNTSKFGQLIADLKKYYKVLYNKNVELITIRHYTHKAVNKVITDKKILLEQKSRNTARFVLRASK
ncbi:MAG: aspartate kinase [Bacteroidetes bacterium]|nr:aspartate kinase [Bacteroidota bacterium]